MPLQLRRGNTAEVGSITPSIGELVYDTQLKRVNVGDGSTAGGVPIAGVTTNEAKDAAAASLLAGTHQNISFTYNSTTKALSAKVDILVHDTIEADAIDTAAVKDGSTVVLDVANAVLYGDVTGDVTGTHFGNIVTNLISSSDSSTILVDTPIEFQTDVEIDGNVIINDNTTVNADLVSNKIIMETRDPNLNVLSMGQQHNETDSTISAGISLRRSRGLGVSPEAVLAGDQLFKITFNGFDGSDFISAVSIRGMVDPAGTVSSNAVPGKLEFFVNDNDGVSKLRMELDRVGTFINYGQHWVRNNVENSLVQNLTSHYNSAGQGSRLSLRRSRGTYDSPTAVTSGDALFRIAFGGYDGANYVESAFIRSTVAGTVSTGVVPSNITISTTNTSGATSVAMEISESQNVKVNKSLTLPTYADSTARDAAITSPQGGMLVYITGTNKFQGYVSGTGWTDLN
jgi:hypothetical protein